MYYMDPDIPRYTTLGLLFGSSWHKVMETFNRSRLYIGDEMMSKMPSDYLSDKGYSIAMGYMAEGLLADNFVSMPDDDFDLSSSQMNLMLQAWANADPSYRWMGDEQVSVIGIEQYLRVDMGSEHHDFVGVIDAVYDTPRGVVICDYKTAGRKWGGSKAQGDPRKLPQAALYAEAWLRLTGEEVNWVSYDVMTKQGKLERIWVKTNAKIRETFVQKWVSTSNEIAMYKAAGMALPANPGSNLCSPKWCGFWDICDFGEALNG